MNDVQANGGIDHINARNDPEWKDIRSPCRTSIAVE